MSIDWSNKDIQEWLETSRQKQEQYYKFLGRYSWVKYKPTEHEFLKSNIAFALFGFVGELNESKQLIEYNAKQRKLIDKMFKLIKEHGDKNDICVSFLYVCCKIDKHNMEFPVIRVPKYSVTHKTNEHMFIDSSFRVYQDWQDFLNNNKLPDCLMCYPIGGRYFEKGNQLQLDKGISPEGQIGSKVLKGFDITTTVIQFASVGVGAVSLFIPMAWPVLVGIVGVNLATGGYITGRSIAQLLDRDDHQQTIGLSSSEARNCYLGIVGSLLGAASGVAVAAVARAAQVGESIAMTGQLALRSITVTSCAANSLGVVNGVANIVQKVADDEEVTALDIFHVTSCVLFFANSVISTCQANMMIKSIGESNTSFMNEISNLANRTMKSVGGIGELVYTGNVPSAVGLGCVSVQTSFISTDVWRKLFEIAQLLWKKVIVLAEYRENIGIYLKMLWDSWNEEIHLVTEKICVYFGIKQFSPIVIDGCKYLAGANPDFLKKLAREFLTQQKKFQNVLETSRKSTTSQNDNTKKDCQGGSSQNVLNQEPRQSTSSQNANKMDEVVEKYQQAVMEISKKLADQLQCESPEDFIRYMKFTCKFIRDEFMKQKHNYEKSLQVVRTFSPVTVEEFDKEYGITTNHNQYFLEQVMKDFKDGNGFLMLRIAYEQQKNLSLAEEADETSITFSNEGNFRLMEINDEGLAPDGWLNRDQYFAIAEKLTEEILANETNAIFEDAGTAIVIIRDAEKIVNITTQKDDDRKVFGIAMMFDNSLS